MIKSSPWRAALAATVATFVVAVPMASAQSAYASAPAAVYQPYPPDLSTATVPAGGVIFFSAEGFEPGELVTATLVPQTTVTLSRASSRSGDGCPDGVKCGTTYRANSEGTVVGCFQVPKDTPPGEYLFTLTGEQSGSVSAPITVTPGNGNGHDHDYGPGGAKGASVPQKGGIEVQPGTFKVSGNGKTLILKPGTSKKQFGSVKEQFGSIGTSQKKDVALAGYDGTSGDAGGGTGPADTGSGTNWALVGGAAGLTAIAVRTVTVVRRRRTRTEQG